MKVQNKEKPLGDEIRLRSDSWATQLTADQQDELYEYASRPDVSWQQAAQEAVRLYGLKKTPSQGAFYSWKRAMFQKDCKRRTEELVIQTAAFGKSPVSDETLLAAYDALAAEAAIDGDVRKAAALSTCAAAVSARIARRQELALKERAQKTREEDLALARERFESAEKRLAAAKETAQDTRLTDKEKLRRLKETFA